MKKCYRQQNPEVLYSKDKVSTVDRSEIEDFKSLSLHNARQRIRLCTHSDSNHALHEMLIVHGKSAYIRPHKHLAKTESMHIIEGRVDIVLFTDNGKIDRIINMGDYASGRIFYYRMAEPIFHTLIIRSDILVFHETTNGPLNRDSTVFAPWSPEEADVNSLFDFMSNLNEQISSF